MSMTVQNTRDWDQLLQRGQLTLTVFHEGGAPESYWEELLEETLDLLMDPRIFPGLVDVRLLPELSRAYNPGHLPVFLIFKRGILVERLSGRSKKRKLASALGRYQEPFLFESLPSWVGLGENPGEYRG